MKSGAVAHVWADTWVKNVWAAYIRLDQMIDSPLVLESHFFILSISRISIYFWLISNCCHDITFHWYLFCDIELYKTSFSVDILFFKMKEKFNASPKSQNFASDVQILYLFLAIKIAITSSFDESDQDLIIWPYL